MHSRVVPLEQAKKCLKGHDAYLRSLEYEYLNPDSFGSINNCIEDLDMAVNGDEEGFDNKCCEWIDLCDTKTRFVALAMMGIRLSDTNWG